MFYFPGMGLHSRPEFTGAYCLHFFRGKIGLANYDFVLIGDD